MNCPYDLFVRAQLQVMPNCNYVALMGGFRLPPR